MFNVKQTFVSAALVLFFTTVQAQAATFSFDAPAWGKASSKTIKFGKSYKGGGASKLYLSGSYGPFSKSRNSNPRAITTLSYYNAVNKMDCKIVVVCKPPAKQKRKFSIFEDGELISRGKVSVKSTANPRGDKFRLKIKYLAEGYSWIGAGKFTICERCTHIAQLIGPEPSPVPLPPTVALLFTTLLGMFGIGKSKKRRKKTAKSMQLTKKPSLI